MTIAHPTQPAALLGPLAIEGTPVAQGSMRSLGRGRPTIHSNGQRLDTWRATIAANIWQATQRHHLVKTPHLEPVSVTAVFTLRPPKDLHRRAHPHPAGPPDLDKLCRAVGDALCGYSDARTEIPGLLRNDAQIVRWHAIKTYPGHDFCALSQPGVWLTIYRLT